MTTLRAFLEQEAVAAEAARIERDRPFQQAEEAFKQTSRELAALERERIRTGRDESFFVDEAVKDATMSIAAARLFNEAEAERFANDTPDWSGTDQDFEVLTDFLYRNGIMVCNAATYRAAFLRLKSYGLLAPAPEQAPERASEPGTIEQEQSIPASEPDYEVGIDPRTQEERRYSKRQIAIMSANEYRLTFGLVTVTRPGEPSR